MACGSVTANGLVVSPTLWQPQRDSNPCLHLERVTGSPLRGAELGFCCTPAPNRGACGLPRRKVGWRNVGERHKSRLFPRSHLRQAFVRREGPSAGLGKPTPVST